MNVINKKQLTIKLVSNLNFTMNLEFYEILEHKIAIFINNNSVDENRSVNKRRREIKYTKQSSFIFVYLLNK